MSMYKDERIDVKLEKERMRVKMIAAEKEKERQRLEAIARIQQFEKAQKEERDRLREIERLETEARLAKKRADEAERKRLAPMITHLHDNNGRKWPKTELELVKKFVQLHPGAINRPGGVGNKVPIYYAVWHGAPLNVVKFMGENMRLENARKFRGTDGWTLLYYAVVWKHYHLIPYLLSIHPESLSIPDSETGFTPLQEARIRNDKRAIELLDGATLPRDE